MALGANLDSVQIQMRPRGAGPIHEASHLKRASRPKDPVARESGDCVVCRAIIKAGLLQEKLGSGIGEWLLRPTGGSPQGAVTPAGCQDRFVVQSLGTIIGKASHPSQKLLPEEPFRRGRAEPQVPPCSVAPGYRPPAWPRGHGSRIGRLFDYTEQVVRMLLEH